MAYSMQPLADKMRPTNLDMVFGQQHIVGEGKLLRKMYENKKLTSMIFYGPPGVGKTTMATVLANHCNLPIYKINATSAGTSDIRDVIQKANGESVLLYVDEIQYFSKKQQQALLEFLENGLITMIASTTENPAFYVYKGLLSRCLSVEFKPLSAEDVKMAVKMAINNIEDFKDLTFEEPAINFIADSSDGDVRKAINNVELLSFIGFSESVINQQMVADIMGRKVFKHDKDGDNHYDIISAFQKSIRGSDPNAALHYLARLIVGGDISIACRRLLVIAAEDIGLAQPMATSIVYGCVHSALELGMPEARIPLAEAVIYLATCPKSNSAYLAIDEALKDLEQGIPDIPDYLRDGHYSRQHTGPEYKYPHDYPGHYVEQKYLPKELEDKIYYTPQENPRETAAKEYWSKIKD